MPPLFLPNLYRTTVPQVREREAVRVLTHQSQYLGELEAIIPRWAKRASWYPQFVHVLAATPRQAQGYEVGCMFELDLKH